MKAENTLSARRLVSINERSQNTDHIRICNINQLVALFEDQGY